MISLIFKNMIFFIIFRLFCSLLWLAIRLCARASTPRSTSSSWTWTCDTWCMLRQILTSKRVLTSFCHNNVCSRVHENTDIFKCTLVFISLPNFWCGIAIRLMKKKNFDPEFGLHQFWLMDRCTTLLKSTTSPRPWFGLLQGPRH